MYFRIHVLSGKNAGQSFETTDESIWISVENDAIVVTPNDPSNDSKNLGQLSKSSDGWGLKVTRGHPWFADGKPVQDASNVRIKSGSVIRLSVLGPDFRFDAQATPFKKQVTTPVSTSAESDTDDAFARTVPNDESVKGSSVASPFDDFPKTSAKSEVRTSAEPSFNSGRSQRDAPNLAPKSSPKKEQTVSRNEKVYDDEDDYDFDEILKQAQSYQATEDERDSISTPNQTMPSRQSPSQQSNPQTTPTQSTSPTSQPTNRPFQSSQGFEDDDDIVDAIPVPESDPHEDKQYESELKRAIPASSDYNPYIRQPTQPVTSDATSHDDFRNRYENQIAESKQRTIQNKAESKPGAGAKSNYADQYVPPRSASDDSKSGKSGSRILVLLAIVIASGFLAVLVGIAIVFFVIYPMLDRDSDLASKKESQPKLVVKSSNTDSQTNANDAKNSNKRIGNSANDKNSNNVDVDKLKEQIRKDLLDKMKKEQAAKTAKKKKKGNRNQSAKNNNANGKNTAPRNRAGGLLLTDVIEKVDPSIVKVETGIGFGSGFVISGDRKIATNFHVIEGAEKATVLFADGTKRNVIGCTVYSTELDLAILQLDKAHNAPPLKFAKQQPKKGTKVAAFGAPAGLVFSTTDGIISAIREGDDLKELIGAVKSGTLLQTTAPISPGNSGGPLVNMDGEVVGVNTFQLVRGQNLNFSVSILELAKLRDQEKQPIQLTELPGQGKKNIVVKGFKRPKAFKEEDWVIDGKAVKGKILSLQKGDLEGRRPHEFERRDFAKNRKYIMPKRIKVELESAGKKAIYLEVRFNAVGRKKIRQYWRERAYFELKQLIAINIVRQMENMRIFGSRSVRASGLFFWFSEQVFSKDEHEEMATLIKELLSQIDPNRGDAMMSMIVDAQRRLTRVDARAQTALFVEMLGLLGLKN